MDMPAVGEIVLYRPEPGEPWGGDGTGLPFIVTRVRDVLIDGKVIFDGPGDLFVAGIPAGDTPGTWRFKPPQIRTS